VFIDGCFWHGCPLHATRPRTNAAFWAAKLDSNIERDANVNRQLRERGWTVIRVWQHELRTLDSVVEKIAASIL
jgi:DNA mismatch endonuclease (patch repair protein)